MRIDVGVLGGGIAGIPQHNLLGKNGVKVGILKAGRIAKGVTAYLAHVPRKSTTLPGAEAV